MGAGLASRRGLDAEAGQPTFARLAGLAAKKKEIYGKFNNAFFSSVVSCLYWSLTFKWPITVMAFGLCGTEFNCNEERSAAG